jgi:glutamyl-tRNA synthetase
LFHVGSGRTALYNWLYARQQGGTFVLRIEDTDTERNQEEHIQGIQRAMHWLGLGWDEGPYFQSQRTELYQSAIDRLVNQAMAYACDCSPEEVQRRHAERGGPPGYDGFCRDRGLEPIGGRVIRFKTPREGSTTVADLVRGAVTFANSSIEDFAIRKSNGGALFLLANVVDDASMEISHVIRGEDHLSNTPKYELLWQALDCGPFPVFAHLPLLVNAKRQKLSKRRDKVALEAYRDEGYLGEAMCNYLALLGWSPGGDREVLSREELVAEFRLEDVISSPAFFDEQKLRSINADHIRALPTEEFIARCQPWLEAPVAPWPPDRFDPAVFSQMAPLVQERARTLSEVTAMVDFFFLEQPAVAAGDWDKAVAKQPAFGAILSEAEKGFADCPWDAISLREATAAAGERAGVPQLAKAQAPVRLAVTGRSIGPPLFESLEVLGRPVTLARLRAGSARLAAGGS